MGTKTRPAGQCYDYNIGDLVDFIELHLRRILVVGKVLPILLTTPTSQEGLTVRCQCDLPIEVQLQDVRRHLYFLCLLSAPNSLLDAGT
ncbi:MAG: hypothetical protein ACKPKO_12695, partial [Candidatus Fonsibacter sp.]